ncbi:MAG: glycoside hydrolase family 1 protein [Chloroflexi bacterium]|nr:glycoside hydrolase family 1 protein [Chloroflexota bacterium]
MAQGLNFPDKFLWGTATSAYQVEGNTRNNQWWDFEQQPGAIWHNDKSGLACDWWRNAEQDFDRMQQLHLNAHRLSIEWSRVEPEPGVFDHRALDRYREMLGGLRARGLEPMVSLYHFTNPRWLEARGGWENAETIIRFQNYARTTVKALGDLCQTWLTVNEPLVYLAQSWFRGIWPPLKQDFLAALPVFRHLLYAHAAAYQTIHACQPHAQVGYASAFRLFSGLRPDHPMDHFAAELKRYLFDHLWIWATVDGKIRPPLGVGQYYPPLANSFDFIGINYYTRDLVRFSPNPLTLFGNEQFSPDAELSDNGRDGPYSEYYPEGLYQLCREMQQFGKPIYITENGLPDRDDDQRPRWLLAHLHQLHRAIEAGCDVRGYFHWTLVDNFEWHEGWNLRFGLFALNPATQLRTARASAHLYGAIAEQNGISQELCAKFAPKLADKIFSAGAAD